MGKYAVIDIGTNSIKFHVAEKRADGNWSVIADRTEVTKLGARLQATGEIQPEAMAKTIIALAGMMREARQQQVDAVTAIGTMGLRTAANGQEFLQRVREECGLAIEIISGEEEARLAYLAATSHLSVTNEPVLVFDTGGGSTEFVFGNGRQIHSAISLNVGAVRYTENVLISDPVTSKEFARAETLIKQELSALNCPLPVKKLIGVGGGMTNLGAVMHRLETYDPKIVQGTVVDRDEIDRQIEMYRSKTIQQRRAIIGLDPRRADVILAGAIIVRETMRIVGVDEVIVSDYGIRHGILLDHFNQ